MLDHPTSLDERSFRNGERRKKHKIIAVICAVLSGALIVLIIIIVVRSKSKESSRTRDTLPPASGHHDVGDNASDEMPNDRSDRNRQKPNNLKVESKTLKEQKEKSPDFEDMLQDKPEQPKDAIEKLKKKEQLSGVERDGRPSTDKLEDNRKKKEKKQRPEDKLKSQDGSNDPSKKKDRNLKKNLQSKDKDKVSESKEGEKAPKKDSKRQNEEDQETAAKGLLTGDPETIAYTPLDPVLVSYLSVEDLDSLKNCIENIPKTPIGLNQSSDMHEWKVGVYKYNKLLLDLHKEVATDSYSLPAEQVKLWARTGFKLYRNKVFAQLLRDCAADVEELYKLAAKIMELNHSRAKLAANYPGITWEDYLELSLASFLSVPLLMNPMSSDLVDLCIAFCQIHSDSDVEALAAYFAKDPTYKAAVSFSLTFLKMTNVNANIYYKKLLRKLENQ